MNQRISKYYKKNRIMFIKVSLLAIIVSAFFLPNLSKLEHIGDNMFTVSLNGQEVGTVSHPNLIDEYLREARRKIAESAEELVLMDARVSYEGEEVWVGRVDSADDIVDNMASVLSGSTRETLSHAYTVKINDCVVNLDTSTEVQNLLESALSKYDTENQYGVELVLDPGREINVLTTRVFSKKDEEENAGEIEIFREAGGMAAVSEAVKDLETEVVKRLEDYELGLVDIQYAESIEVVDAYLPKKEILTLEEAKAIVTDNQATEQIYEVQSGDTLSEIAIKTSTTMDDLIAMNSMLSDEGSLIREGDELRITVPEPELSVAWNEDLYLEENYEAEVQYVDNPNWFITDTKTIQEPSSGFRKAVMRISYRNDKEISREVIAQEVVAEAVPKIVERGTKVPPTYIKPLSGGRLSSGFGRRSRPTRGASTFHKGVDWATPTGTAVWASNSGTVIRAGWGSGYGYCVYIQHADGRVTRYGHLSKVLVSTGQSVKQGQKIALSGNTGVSSGPHVHFEILINGVQVNPLNYLN